MNISPSSINRFTYHLKTCTLPLLASRTCLQPAQELGAPRILLDTCSSLSSVHPCTPEPWLKWAQRGAPDKAPAVAESSAPNMIGDPDADLDFDEAEQDAAGDNPSLLAQWRQVRNKPLSATDGAVLQRRNGELQHIAPLPYIPNLVVVSPP